VQVATKQVRERILEAAMLLLREPATRLAQPRVARLAGIPQGHLTYYFPKKTDLVAAVARRFADIVKTDLERLGADYSASDGPQRLPDFLAERVRDRDATRMLLRMLVEADGDPHVREIVIQAMRQCRAVLAQMLGRDESHADVNIALAAFWGLGILHLFLNEDNDLATTQRVLRRADQWLRHAPPPED